MESKNGHGERWEAQLRKGSLDLVILAVLWNERLYGLEILRRLQQSASLDLAEGTLYPILMRLKQEGLLESTWVEAETGHPRKYYKLTRAGRKRAGEMQQAWEEFSAGISRLLTPIKEEQR
jgi:PadR family transcriptional regulator PadR